jgi:type 1 glutamine amidotransferase
MKQFATTMCCTLLLTLALLAAPAIMPGAGDARAAEAAKPLRVLLVTGGCCHDYKNQKDILKEGLEKRINVVVTQAHDTDSSTHHLNPVYDNDDWAKGFDAVIHDECSADVKDLATIDKILAPHRDGLPSVVLHCGMHCYRSDGWNKADSPTPWQQFLGLQSSGHRRQAPIAVTYVDTTHAITTGLENWTTINEELYNNFAGKLLPTAHALARGKQDNFDDVVTWTNVYNGKTRVFCTTLGHNNKTVGDDRYLDLLARGLLWSCGKLTDDGKPAPGYGR